MDRPPVELVEEIPSPEAAARKAFVAGAISAGVVCAVVGTVVGFVLGVQSSLPRRQRGRIAPHEVLIAGLFHGQRHQVGALL
jgi:hypothetical protein